MAKHDFLANPGNCVYLVFNAIGFHSPGCLLSEFAGWTLVNFERFLKMGKIQDGRQRPF